MSGGRDGSERYEGTASPAEDDRPTRPLPLRTRPRAATVGPAPAAVSHGDGESGGARTQAPREMGLSVGATAAALRGWGGRGVRAARAWFDANSFAPRWAPAPLRAPELGYLAAIGLQIVAVACTFLLVQTFGSFVFAGVPELLAIALTALNWGAGPSIVAMFVGGMLLNYVVLSPRFALSFGTGRELVEMVIFFLTGIAISVIASQTERERRTADGLARRLAAEQARLEAIIEAVPDLISIHDAAGHIVRVNAAAQAFLHGTGERTEPMSRRDDIRLLTPEGAPVPEEALPSARALTGETVRGVELLTRVPGEDERVLEVSAAPFRDAWGAIVGAVTISRDVTAQRHIEREAAERARLIEATFEAMVDGVVVYDAAGHISRMNAAARAIFAGAAPPEFPTRPIDERTHALRVFDDQGQPIPPDRWPGARILRGETLTSLAASEVRFTMADGAEVWLNVTGAPVRAADGSVAGGIAIYHDVTERRRLERRTYESLLAVLTVTTTLLQAPDEGQPEGERAVAQRLLDLTRSALGARRIGISLLDPRTDVLRALAVAGLPPEQERQWWAEQEALTRQGVRFSDSPDQETVARLRAGEALTFDMTRPPYDALPNPYGIKTFLVAPMRLGDELVGLLTYDYGGAEHVYTPSELALAGAVARLAALVIERERLLREREEARASALAFERANQRMDEFLGIASHELKTPLTTIKANVQLSLRRLSGLDPDAPDAAEQVRRLQPARGLLERSERQVDRLDRLVSDLLDVSRIRAGKLELRPEMMDLAEVVRDAVQEQRQAWPHRTITLTAPAGPVPVEADPDRIGQVVTNYLTNALKYSPDEAPVEVRLELLKDGDGDECAARVSVRDRGPGLPPQERARVWERFHRAPGVEVQSGSGVGLGLGLHISKNIVERHGGAVGVESEPGAGSTFWFTLPGACEGRVRA